MIHQSVRVIISAQIRDWITQHAGNEAFNKSDLSEHHDVVDVVDVGGGGPGGRQSQLFLLGHQGQRPVLRQPAPQCPDSHQSHPRSGQYLPEKHQRLLAKRSCYLTI